ncbi:MAG: BatD family protein [Bacteroidia bacterium]
MVIEMRKYSWFLSAILLFITAPLDAQITGSVDKTKVGTRDVLTLSFTLKGRVEGYDPPSLPYFQVVSGPNVSSSIQIINGRRSDSKTYSYVLRPRQAGTFTIGPAKAKVNGEEVQTEPIRIEVVEGSTSASGQEGREEQPSGSSGDDLFIRTTASKTTAYQGEQIVVSFKLYSAKPLVDLAPMDFPSFPGFWAEDFERPREYRVQEEVYKGRRFQTIEIKRTAIFPEKTGSLEIEPMQLQVMVREPGNRRSFFDDFFGNSRNAKYEVRSNILKINVKPLPSGKPESFAGLVGTFNLNSTIDKTEAKTGEGITLKFNFNGTGNIKKLNQPELKLPSDVEVFDPQVEQKLNNQGSQITGSKSYDFLLVPRRAGEYTIAPQEFSYFDPGQERYITMRSPEFKLYISQGEKDAAGPIPSAKKKDVETLGEDIRYIKTGEAELEKEGNYFFGSPAFTAGVAVPVVLMGLLLVYKRKRKEESLDGAGMRRRKATTIAKKHLKKANEFRETQQQEEFYTEINTALMGYLKDKLTIGAADMDREKLQEMLALRGVRQENIEQLLQVMNHCDFARFAPTPSGDMHNTYTQTVTLISDLEEQLK